jgi:16S rRNA (cytosine1402-N4)-methyltransferase
MSQRNEYHTPVLLEELLSLFLFKTSGVFLDGTLGGGGHFRAMAGRLDVTSTLIGIDRDPEAIAWNRELQHDYHPRIIMEQAVFSQFDTILARHRFTAIDGVLLDLGVSSRQIDESRRGFSYLKESDLDMRMDPSSGIPAREFIAQADEAELARVLNDYGEVKGAGRVARSLKAWGRKNKLASSLDVRQWYGQTFGGNISINLLARIFQALRIAVNDELGELKRFFNKIINYLNPGARIAVIAYHSLEDRMVKEFIRKNERACVCPPELPRCMCSARPLLKRVTRKALRPSPAEVKSNPRARSARLRIAERTEGTR